MSAIESYMDEASISTTTINRSYCAEERNSFDYGFRNDTELYTPRKRTFLPKFFSSSLSNLNSPKSFKQSSSPAPIGIQPCSYESNYDMFTSRRDLMLKNESQTRETDHQEVVQRGLYHFLSDSNLLFMDDEDSYSDDDDYDDGISMISDDFYREKKPMIPQEILIQSPMKNKKRRKVYDFMSKSQKMKDLNNGIDGSKKKSHSFRNLKVRRYLKFIGKKRDQ